MYRSRFLQPRFTRHFFPRTLDWKGNPRLPRLIKIGLAEHWTPENASYKEKSRTAYTYKPKSQPKTWASSESTPRHVQHFSMSTKCSHFYTAPKSTKPSSKNVRLFSYFSHLQYVQLCWSELIQKQRFSISVFPIDVDEEVSEFDRISAFSHFSATNRVRTSSVGSAILGPNSMSSNFLQGVLFCCTGDTECWGNFKRKRSPWSAISGPPSLARQIARLLGPTRSATSCT